MPQEAEPGSKKRAKRPTTHWRVLRAWMERELAPMGGQDGTAEMWESIEALDEHFDAIKRGAATKRQALKRGRAKIKASEASDIDTRKLLKDCFN